MKIANTKVIAIFILLLTISIHAATLEQRLTDPQTQKEAMKEIQKDPEKYADELKSIIQVNKKSYRKQLSDKEINEEKDDNSHVKVTATLLLGRLKIDSAKEAIEDNLTKDKDEFVREASALALAEMFLESGEKSQESGEKRKQRKTDNMPGLDKSITALRKALEDESGNVRMRAILALAKISHQFQVISHQSEKINIENLKERALAGIKSKNTTESLLAIDSLEAIADKSLIPLLKQNLESKNVWTKIHSKLAIKRIEIQDLAEAERINYLKEALEDEQFEVSRWAGIELLQIDTKESEKILIEAAKQGNYAAGKVLRIKKNKGNK